MKSLNLNKLLNPLGALAIAAFAAFYLMVGMNYRLGSLRAMGPGFFPVTLAVICLTLSLYAAFTSFRKPENLSPIAWRAFLASSGCIAFFALTVKSLGLVPATIGAVLIAAVGDRSSRPLGTIVLALVVVAAAWLIFTRGLGLPLPAFRQIF